MPEFLDFGHVLAAEIGQRLLDEARGYTNPHAAGDQFQQRVAALCVELVKPFCDLFRRLAAREVLQGFDDGGKPQIVRPHRLLTRPDQADRLGHVADEIIGIAEQDGIDAFLDQCADHGRFDGRDVEIAGDRRNGITAVGVRR